MRKRRLSASRSPLVGEVWMDTPSVWPCHRRRPPPVRCAVERSNALQNAPELPAEIDVEHPAAMVESPRQVESEALEEGQESNASGRINAIDQSRRPDGCDSNAAGSHHCRRQERGEYRATGNGAEAAEWH